MIPVNWNFDPTLTDEISERIVEFAAEMQVPSKFLNGIQDQVVRIVKAARNGSPEQILLYGGTDPRAVAFEYFDSGHSGASSADGLGSLAKVTDPGGITVIYTYNGDGSVATSTVSDGTITVVATFSYSVTTGNCTGVSFAAPA